MACTLPCRAALALALLVGCAGASRQATPAGQPADLRPVTLRFAWPDGFRVRIDLRHEATRTGRPPTHAVVRQQLETEQRNHETWVFTRDSRGEGDEPDLELNLKIGEALVYVVSREGALLRVEGLEKAIDLLKGDVEENREQVRASLVRMATEDWAVTAGAWRGRRLEERKPQHERVEGSVALIPGIPASLDVELGLEGRVSCIEGQEPRCVQLRYVSVPAPSGKDALLERLRAGISPEDGVLEDAAARYEATIVTEPDTLIPYRLLVRQQLRLRIRPPAGDVREVEEQTSDDYRFTQELEI